MLRTSPCVLSRKKPVSPFALLVFTNVKIKYVQIIRFIYTTYTSSVSSTSVNPAELMFLVLWYGNFRNTLKHFVVMVTKRRRKTIISSIANNIVVKTRCKDYWL